ncbi:MAG: hypothetical protein CVV04_12515 [Firmicutes bacterium HGW-Firmicutes-9]|jgi:hypothetical protein|nr:MAG: hypothetical protein CVV04_12515 [Firmicutes bacterium HGW-Firmicutes-9]
MGKVISGYTEIESAKFTFFLNDFLLTLVLYKGELPRDMFFKQYNLKNLKGETTDHREICFFGLSFYSGFMSSSLETYISGYVIGRNNNSDVEISSFSALSLYGSIVDKYYNPIIKYDHKSSSNDYEKGTSIRILKSYDEVDYHIKLAPHLDMTLGIVSPSEPTPYNSKLGDLHSYLSITTDLEWDLDRLIALYRNIYQFFALFNFRKNISFDEIVLSKRMDDGRLDPIGNFIVATKNPCTSVHQLYTIYHSDINEHIVDLYFFLKQFGSYLSFIPETDNDARILDYSKYIQTCAVFESLFKKYHKNLAGSTPKTTLKSKFKFALNEYRNIIVDVFSNIELKDSDIEDIAKAFVDQRNDLAHGDFERRVFLSVTPYTYAVCLIYIMILRLIKIEDQTIKRVIKKMFWNFGHKDIAQSENEV